MTRVESGECDVTSGVSTMRLAPDDTPWDVIVIGTGMGGATVGYELALAGQRVLFCEKGRMPGSPTELAGRFPEECSTSLDPRDMKESMSRAGRSLTVIEDRSARTPRRFVPLLGSGVGGSTALYGMALERFFPADLASWPIPFEDLVPHYEAIEERFHLSGGGDPLREERAHPRPAPPLPAASAELFDFFGKQGLHPYRLPLACEHRVACAGCQGMLCANDCKNDATRVCLVPAISLHGARLLDECEVLRLEATDTEVTSVICERHGQSLRLRGRRVVLAAGALHTPSLLIRSRSPEWPQGLANHSGLVGRNLMRHFVDLYAVFTRARPAQDRSMKDLAFNDLYVDRGLKLGTVQSFGQLPPGAVMLAEAAETIAVRWPRLAALFNLVRPLLGWFLDALLARCVVLAMIFEDPPDEDNRVEPSPDGTDALIVTYHIRDPERTRIAHARSRLSALLRPYRFLLIKQAENNHRLAHACGTCRMGIDPRRSVVDAENRAHGLANLYIVDSSFFPTSAGMNPSLTIAANARRVAQRLIMMDQARSGR